MVRGKKNTPAARADPPAREPRARKAKEAKPQDPEESGTDGDAVSQPTAPRRSGRARTVSQPPAYIPAKKATTRSSKRTAVAAAESGDDEAAVTDRSPSAKRQRLSNDSPSRSPPANDEPEDVSPKQTKHRRAEKPKSKATSSANPIRSRSSTPADPESPSGIVSSNPSDTQKSANPPINSSSAIDEPVSPSPSRRSNGKRRRIEEPSQPEDHLDTIQPSSKKSKRARFSPKLPPTSDINGKASSEQSSEQADAPEVPLESSQQASQSVSQPTSPVPDAQIESSMPVSPAPDSQNDAPFSTPDSPIAYSTTIQEVDFSENRPTWTEPSLAPRLEKQLQSIGSYDHFSKMEYCMDNEKDGLHDTLGEKRNLLKKTAPIRGRGRGRGRGSRGGRGGGRLANVDHPETSEPLISTVTTRGRGGYRVKKSENPYIQALYHRRAAIRNQYKAIGNFQRAALEALGEKSLEILKEDFLAHTKLPAFDQTAKKLGEIFDTTITRAEARLKYESDFYRRDKENNEEYERQMHHYAAKEEDASTFTEFLLTINHIARQVIADATADEVPYYPSDEGFKIVRIVRPKKVVALEGTPYGVPGDWPATVGEHVNTIGDLENEQHPANFKLSIHPEDRKKYQQELSKRKKRIISDATDKPSTLKSKSLLGPSIEASANPLAPTPAEGSDADPAQDDDDDSSSDGDIANANTDSVDQYGLKFVNKPAPKKGLHPNNRFVVEPHFEFEEHEIGIRAQRNKRTNTGDAQYIGRDPNPNPKAFHFDQRATGQWNTAKFKQGDLDEEIVAAFKVHPIYGLAIPGCINPTNEDLPDDQKHIIKPRSDWSVPLAPTQPILFIEEDPASTITNDKYRKVYHTSRSVSFVRARQIFDESIAKTRISRVLKEVYEEYQGIKLNTIFHEPVADPTPTAPVSVESKEEEVTPSLLPSLIEAANQAKQLLTDEEVAEARIKFLRSTVRRYDPVRDEFTSSTYSSSPTSAPLPASMAEDRSSLHLLANVAESPRFSRRHPPPPPAFHQGFVATPAPWVSTNHPHSHGHPQQQARPAAGSSSLRPLRPAPPQVPPSPTSNAYRY